MGLTPKSPLDSLPMKASRAGLPEGRPIAFLAALIPPPPLAGSYLYFGDWSGPPMAVERSAIAKWLFPQEKSTLKAARNATS